MKPKRILFVLVVFFTLFSLVISSVGVQAQDEESPVEMPVSELMFQSELLNPRDISDARTDTRQSSMIAFLTRKYIPSLLKRLVVPMSMDTSGMIRIPTPGWMPKP